MILCIIKQLLVTVYDRIQFFRNSKHHMKVWGIQYVLPAGINPFFPGEFLAHGTAPVPAGIIVDGNTAAAAADTYVNAESTCLAVHDVISCLPLQGREIMGLFKTVIKSVENILY